jgi:hypothetical protein
MQMLMLDKNGKEILNERRRRRAKRGVHRNTVCRARGGGGGDEDKRQLISTSDGYGGKFKVGGQRAAPI